MTSRTAAIGWMLRALMIPFAGLTSAAVWADDSSSRWSLGMQIGQASGNGDSAPAAMPTDLSTMSYDMAATVGGANRFGWRVFTGYRLTNYLAIHVGYADLGAAQARLGTEPAALDGALSFERRGVQTVRGMDLGLQLKVPVSERVRIDVRGGKYYWESRTHIAAAWSEGYRGDYRSTRRDSDSFIGAGLEVDVVADLSATAGWTRYNVGSEPVALWTVGALYRFGIY